MASTVIAVGMSRLYLGLHYPTDVLGGWLLGLACIATSYRIYRGYRS
jgi:undecaprenyl-diphosphatase